MINWGIIGCGSVTEVKSGPAFNLVEGSSLTAVMSRSLERARDYALRKNVPAFYNDGHALINDPSVNAVYIATPPSSHEEWCVSAITAGKPVYVEKPFALNYPEAIRIAELAERNKIKLSVAHYRRAQPLFIAIKELLHKNAIGNISGVELKLLRPLISMQDLERPATRWRVDPRVSGGGFYHDLSPHQLDLMLWYFGSVRSAAGFSSNNNSIYAADDFVTGSVEFENGILFKGTWNFNHPGEPKEECLISGSEGSIRFSFFSGDSIMLKTVKENHVLRFNVPQYAQQPMIEKVVSWFRGHSPNPCSGYEAAEVMRIIDLFTGNV